MFTLPSSTEITAGATDYAGFAITTLLPVGLLIVGVIVGALVVSVVIGTVIRAVSKITGKGRSGGRRGGRGRR